jgi:hypothetical protein
VGSLTERREPPVDLGGYALGLLGEVDQAGVADHLASCPSCRSELGELAVATDALERMTPAWEPPPGLRSKALAAVERAAAAPVRAAAPARPLGSRLSLPRLSLPRLGFAAAAATVAAAALVGVWALRSGGPATLELEAVLVATGGGPARATADVTKTGIGRVVVFATDDLPILPTGEYYELWFVGPGDTPARPNRISAGTFHPDEQGRSNVTFAAAVDPAKYPVLSVTAEPGDGNPARTGPEVLRSRVSGG